MNPPTSHVKVFKSEYQETLEREYANWINGGDYRKRVKGTQFSATDKYVVLLVF